MNQRQISVCVLGAGVCGIVTTKICLENGFQVECLDRSPHYGGLWRYHDDKLHPEESFIPSIMKTTILNTTKELSSFSDFPPPPKYPNNMKHELYMHYIESYVRNFNLSERIKLKQEVLKCELRRSPESKHFEWLVTVKELTSGKLEERKYDKLIVATGHHNRPYTPTFPDQHKFRGPIIHSGRIKNVFNDQRFHDKRVLVVGFGNSACDIASDLALVARRCYLSSHRGNWLLSRLNPKGLTEHLLKTRYNMYKSKFLSSGLTDRKFLKLSRRLVDHQLIGVAPKHKPTEQVPVLNDLFHFRVYTGGVTLKSSIVRFNEASVEFEGEEDSEYELDAVVLATGYTAEMDFIDEFKLGVKSAETNEYELFMNVFAPKLSLPELTPEAQARAVESLAFVGLVQPAGSMTVVSEIQARWICQVFAKKRHLPSVEEMLHCHERVRKRREKAIRSHSRDVICSDWMSYVDEIAGFIGARPNLVKLFIKDFQLWRTLMFGPAVPYQYRLEGPGRWDRARETIMTVEDRVYQGINDGKNHILFKTRRKSLNETNSSKQIK